MSIHACLHSFILKAYILVCCQQANEGLLVSWDSSVVEKLANGASCIRTIHLGHAVVHHNELVNWLVRLTLLSYEL